jgi:hypothetical protein
MKKILLSCLLLLAVNSCVYKETEEDRRETLKRSPSACEDSLFLALKNKPYASLTAFEHHYFEMMFDKCYDVPIINQSGPAEWWVAAPVIISFALAAIYFVAHVL